MDDLISRQDAIEEIENIGVLDGYTDKLELLDKIRNLPSAQPERKKGHWIKISPSCIYECSVCHQDVLTPDIDVYEFCHHCGADMKGEENGND